MQQLAQNQIDFLRPLVFKAFSILGFSNGSVISLAQIKKRYRKLALIHHPDKGGNEEKMKELVLAYEFLIGKTKMRIPPPQRVVWVQTYSYYTSTTATTACW